VRETEIDEGPINSISLPYLLLLHSSSKPVNTSGPFPVTSFAVHAPSLPTDDTASLNNPSVCHALIMKKQLIRLRSKQCPYTSVYLPQSTLNYKSRLLESLLFHYGITVRKKFPGRQCTWFDCFL
jgi:hypothetical protein